MTEKKIGEEPDQEDPDQEPSCKRGKEESSNPVMDGHHADSLSPQTVSFLPAIPSSRQYYQIRLNEYSAKLTNLQKV